MERFTPLSATEEMLEMRAGFFNAVAANLLSDGRRDDAGQDPLGRHTGKFPELADITFSVERCWMSVKEAPARPFQIAIWQPGRHLRIGARLPPWLQASSFSVSGYLDSLFGTNKPFLSTRAEHYFYDWHFGPVNMADPVEVEQYTFYVQNLFDTLLHATSHIQGHG